MEIKIELPTDEDGYLEYECPHCQNIFSLKASSFTGSGNETTLYCPYCGLNSDIKNFYTKECVEYLKSYAKQLVAAELQKSFKKIERDSKNSLIRFERENIEPNEVSNLTLHPGINNLQECKYCSNSYKIKDGYTISYCPYCGGIK